MSPKKTSRSVERRQFWQKHIDNWSTSGLSQAQYCRDHSLNTLTFYSWKKKLTHHQSQSPRFVAVNIPSPQKEDDQPKGSTLCLKLSNGMGIEVADGFSQQTLERLIETVTRAV